MASSPAALKQQAAALELKKQPEKALALYQQLLSEHGASADVDVALRNRVGDLHLRVGQIDDAIVLFERSADDYALSGFLNNAIALCNKILRQRPGHVPTLRRLARFSAEKGMVVDAQRHYLSVAEALEKLGQHGEALKALSEFAELSPEDVHVRSVVVEQLLRAGRKVDALPHLTVLHRLHVGGGRDDEAEGVATVAREIDAQWVPESEQTREGKRADVSLILLDSDDDFGMLETLPMLGVELDQSLPLGRIEGLELAPDSGLDGSRIVATEVLSGFEATSRELPAAESGMEELTSAGATPDADSVADDTSLDFLDIGDVESPAPAASHASDIELLDVLDDHRDDHAVTSAEPELYSADLEASDMAMLGDLGVTPVEGSPMALPDYVTRETATFDTFTPDLPPASPATVSAARFDEGVLDLPPVPVADALAPEPVAAEPVAAPTPPPPLRVKRPTPTYVNLADILREDEPTTARMTIGEPRQTGDQDADFRHILSEFREGIEKSIPIDDVESHFDLGIAFREMGLVDDAIAEFQIAARSRLKRVEALEALGGCFIDKGEPQVALTVLQRALDDPAGGHSDDSLRGVLYLMGRASEFIGARDDGLRYYQRVYAVDIRFRDVAARIQTLQQPV